GHPSTSPARRSSDLFASWQYSANEKNGQAVITVARNAPLDAAASVDYAVQDGTAKAGNDYQTTAGTPSFAPRQSSPTFSIPLNRSEEHTPELQSPYD